MITSSSRRDLIDRLRYTFINADYKEIDVLIAGLQNKSNYEELCEEFFQGCSIDSRGYLVPSGFFSDNAGTVSLLYAMYELLGCSPDTFLLKHRVTRVKFIGKDLTGYFRIPRGLFSLPRIEALIVRGIGISRLPDNVHAARSLRILDLGSNRFSRFPESILKLPNLTALNMSYNDLSALPDGIGRLKRLRIFNLKGNALSVLPPDWHRLQNLRTLDLSMNRLKTVPDSLRTLVALKELRLAYNELSATDEALWEKRSREDSLGDQGSLGIGS
ncbi:MAG: leucine-rich repeat domain-containing protein [Spirochaetaceae bacterium]|nr:leucine-rich repeat domain-containing protein [Spirochaetaceae bacterium]